MSELERAVRGCLAAGCAASLADVLFNPLYVVQVRAQLDPHVSASTLARNAVARNGFVAGLWQPGALAIFFQALTYSGCRVGLYPLVRDALPSDLPGTRLVAGCATGYVSAGLLNPFEVVRVRMSSMKPYASTPEAFVAIAREGGASANAARAGLYSGFQLASYEGVKRLLLDWKVFSDGGPATHCTAGFASGLCAQFACHPADTLKTRAMDSRGGRVSLFGRLCGLLKDRGLPGSIEVCGPLLRAKARR